MNITTYRTTALLLILAALVSSSGLAAAQSPRLLVPNTLQAVTEIDATLDLCMYNEPFSLYHYTGTASLVQWYVNSAIYDGPIDQRTYAYQPVIFEKVPTLDNGGAYFAQLNVYPEDLIVDSSGNVVELAVGVEYLPAGCYDAGCAESYSSGIVLMEQMVVTHSLLPGLLWSDGAPLTATDMIYSYTLDGNPDTPSSDYRVERTASYLANGITETVWRGLPGYFPSDYSLMYWTPLPSHLWNSFTAAELAVEDLSNRTPLGWGPYVIDEWVAGSHIAMHKNPNYFRAAEGLPHFDALIVHFGTELDGMLSGACDVVFNTSEDLATLLAYDDVGLFEVDFVGSTSWEHLDFGIQSVDAYTGFAAVTQAFQDVNVRKAFAYCIDRQAIAAAVYAGLGVVPNALIPDSHPYFPADAEIYPYDPILGRALLAGAGWIDSNGNGIRDRAGVEFSATLHTTDTAIRYTTVSMIAAQMADCGIEVIPVHLTFPELFLSWPDGVVIGRQFDLAEFAWIQGWLPACELYSTWSIPTDTFPQGQNYPGYSNGSYDAACQAASTSLTEEDRLTNYGEVIRLFTKELPVLPLFNRLKIAMAASHISGVTLDPTDNTIWNIELLSVGVTEEIPTTGGELLSPEDTTAYTFPEDTFSEDVVVTHIPLSPVSVPETGELDGAGHFYSLEATVEDVPVDPEVAYTVTIEYTDGELGMLNEATLGLYYWDGDSWVLEPTSVVNPDTNTLTATPDHFSLWAILGEPYLFSFLPLIGK